MQHSGDAQALWFTGPRQIEVRTEEVGPPVAGELLIQSLYSGISTGTEMLVYRGEVAADTALDLPTLAGSFAFPIKYGYASVGRVLDTGPGVTAFQSGDLVFALHPHQTLFCAPQDYVSRLPADIDPAHGVFFANLETALTIVHDAAPRLGEMVVVSGQGVVGLLVTQLLRLTGVSKLLTVDPVAFRRELSFVCGADAAYAPDTSLFDAIWSLCGQRRPDSVIEVSGRPEALQSAIDLVADEGTVIVASWYGSKISSLQLGGRFHRGRIRLRSSQVGRIPPELGPRWDRARRSAMVAQLLGQLQLAPLISHRISYGQAAQAYDMLDRHADNVCQIVLDY